MAEILIREAVGVEAIGKVGLIMAVIIRIIMAELGMAIMAVSTGMAVVIITGTAAAIMEVMGIRIPVLAGVQGRARVNLSLRLKTDRVVAGCEVRVEVSYLSKSFSLFFRPDELNFVLFLQIYNKLN